MSAAELFLSNQEKVHLRLLPFMKRGGGFRITLRLDRICHPFMGRYVSCANEVFDK